MSERSLRGTRLGSLSYEDDRQVELAERQHIEYDCPEGHRFGVPFSTEADVPALWDCPRCGTESLRVDTERPIPKFTKPARTHWDMLLERRNVQELKELLDERLALLRAGELVGGEHLARRMPKKRKSA